MPRALLCFTLSIDAPGLTHPGRPAHLSRFGRWLRDRIAMMPPQWPAVAFHRLGFVGSAVRLVLCLRHPAPPLVVGLAVARVLQRETAEAARAAGWLEEGVPLWRVGGTVVVAVTSRPERSEGSASSGYDRTRRSRMTATIRNTMFIDQAANHGATSSLPPTAFMIWMPVR